MADLQINYDRLHELANDSRNLKAHLDDKVPGLSTGSTRLGASSGEIGSSVLASKLTKFHLAWNQPFKDAMSKLGDLADLLDGVATKFFDMDSDFAGKANTMLAQQNNSNWQSTKDQYDASQQTKNMMFQPSPLYDENGVLQPQAPVPMTKPEDLPPDPGPRPTHTNVPSTPTVTDSTYDGQGRVTSETSAVKSPSGLAYNETTTYTYNGDSQDPSGYTTKITHSDGSTETLDQNTHPDGTYTTHDTTKDGTTTNNVTPKPKVDGQDVGYTAESVDDKGQKSHVDVVNNPGSTTADTKTVKSVDGTKTYTGNADADTWTLTDDAKNPDAPGATIGTDGKPNLTPEV